MNTEQAKKSLLSESRSSGGIRMKKWIRKVVFLLLIGLGIWYFFLKGDPPVEYVTESVKTGVVRQIVEVNGTVEAKTRQELGFQSSGKIDAIMVQVGDEVKKGDALATLSAGTLSIEVEKAEASLQMAQADLNLKYAGATPEEIRISETQVEEARLSLKHSVQKLDDINRINRQKEEKAEQELKNAEIALKNAEMAYETTKGSGDVTERISEKNQDDTLIKSTKIALSALNALDHAVSAMNDVVGKNTYGSESAQYPYIGFFTQEEKTKTSNQYRVLVSSSKKLNATFQDIGDQEEMRGFLTELEMEIEIGKELTDQVFILLNNSVTGTSLTQAQIDVYKSSIKVEQASLLNNLDAIRDAIRDIQNADLNRESASFDTTGRTDTAKTNLDAINSALLLAQQNLADIKIQNENSLDEIKRQIETQKLQLQKARESHQKLLATPRSVDTAALQANVFQRTYAWQQAIQNLDDTIIVAPADGIITDVTREEGENINPSDTVVVVMSEGIEIQANVPETDITKLAVGNPVDIRLDAFPSEEVFSGKIQKIDPAETVVQGVIYYRTTTDFEVLDERIKSGMTSDMEILSAEKSGVLVLSPETIQYEENQPFVFLLENGKKVKREVSIGIEGEDAVEITSGISQGEKVIWYEKMKEE